MPTVPVPVPTQNRHLTASDFGIGYNSSGYASRRRYTSSWAPS
jgi:hypothetical protein